MSSGLVSLDIIEVMQEGSSIEFWLDETYGSPVKCADCGVSTFERPAI